MKHILNEMSNEEKNSIRSQHTGSLTVQTERFKKLVENKLGNAKPLINEDMIDDYDDFDDEVEDSEDEGYGEEPNEEIFNLIDDECANSENDDECVTFLNMVIEYCEDKLYEMGQYGGSDEEEDLGFASHSGDFEGDDSEFEDDEELDEDETW